ncbi:MAG TPA: hypothetical protein VKV31_00615 [bacterium]|nr:hypothetical protein [bacterium]
MDKALSQAIILMVMIALASGATLIYSRYTEPNTPQAQAEAQVYAQDAASLFYASTLELYTDSINKSLFWFIPPQSTLGGWLCRDLVGTKYGVYSAPCSDMVAANNSVTRSFTTSFWDYYAVMVYLPEGTPQLNLTFNWWLKSPDWVGWVWLGAFIIKGDATGVGKVPFDVVESAPFYWSSEFWGDMRSGVFQGLTVSGGYTLAVLLEAIPSYATRISYGFTIKLAPQNIIKVILPGANYSVALSSGSQRYGVKSGPVAVFNIKSNQISGQLEVYYNGVPVAQTSSSLQAGEEVVFYVDPSSQQPPQTLLTLNTPIQVLTSNDTLTVKYSGVSETIKLNAELLGGGISNAWIIALVGCQEKCVVVIQPA